MHYVGVHGEEDVGSLAVVFGVGDLLCGDVEDLIALGYFPRPGGDCVGVGSEKTGDVGCVG